MSTFEEPTKDQLDTLLTTLRKRFEENPQRHPDLSWNSVEKKLRKNPAALKTLYWMEESGGQPDMVVLEDETKSYRFVDCSPESPKGRRSVCYDQAALEARKKHKPDNSAQAMCDEMGVEMLTEAQYRRLQEIGEFDLKTSSWVFTPKEVRDLGGALFCDRRFNKVFLYHNGAESYYAARGFRASVLV